MTINEYDHHAPPVAVVVNTDKDGNALCALACRPKQTGKDVDVLQSDMGIAIPVGFKTAEVPVQKKVTCFIHMDNTWRGKIWSLVLKGQPLVVVANHPRPLLYCAHLRRSDAVLKRIDVVAFLQWWDQTQGQRIYYVGSMPPNVPIHNKSVESGLALLTRMRLMPPSPQPGTAPSDSEQSF